MSDINYTLNDYLGVLQQLGISVPHHMMADDLNLSTSALLEELDKIDKLKPKAEKVMVAGGKDTKYNSEVVLKMEKKPKELKVFDAYGREICVGDYISNAVMAYRTTTIRLCLVEKIDAKAVEKYDYSTRNKYTEYIECAKVKVIEPILTNVEDRYEVSEISTRRMTITNFDKVVVMKDFDIAAYILHLEKEQNRG